MPAHASEMNPRFVRRTTLQPDEYRRNFYQIDCDVLRSLISDEARRVCRLMPHVYLALIQAPPEMFERNGVLRFTALGKGKGSDTGWKTLCRLAGVSNSTLSKCLTWLHESGIIGYSAFSNGVGNRIFLNRAASSIGKRAAVVDKPFLLSPTPFGSAPTPPRGAAFRGVRDKELLDCKESPAPGGAINPPVVRTSSLSRDEVAYILRETSNEMNKAFSREAAKTREWLEKAGIPKAIRVAQAEAFSVWRSKARGQHIFHEKKPSDSHPIVEKEVFSSEYVVQTWIDYAECVRGKTLDALVADYVSRGEMQPHDAEKLLRSRDVFQISRSGCVNSGVLSAHQPENSC